jgi:hypothetical protein
MQVEDTVIAAVEIVTPKKHGDARGFFSEVYCRAASDGAGLKRQLATTNSVAMPNSHELHHGTRELIVLKGMRDHPEILNDPVSLSCVHSWTWRV